MKALFIGGTGTISMAITRQLLKEGHEIYLLNRGSRNAELPGNVHWLQADINTEEERVAELIKDMTFDVVADFIVFHKYQAERDYRLFKGKCKQYMTFSSASCYQKPPVNYIFTESTPLANPYWQYSRDKIEIEEYLMKLYREEGFPITIIRPSHTYDERNLPLGVDFKGSYAVIKRILDGKPVIIHGDGTTLWTVTFNSDLAKGFIGLMMNPHAIGENFHITTDEVNTWNQLYQYVADALGKELKVYHVSTDFLADCGEEYDVRSGMLGDKSNNVILDNSKIKNAVPGFLCTVRANEGFKITVDYIMSHPELQKESPEYDAWCDAIIEAQEEAKKAVLKKLGK